MLYEVITGNPRRHRQGHRPGFIRPKNAQDKGLGDPVMDRRPDGHPGEYVNPHLRHDLQYLVPGKARPFGGAKALAGSLVGGCREGGIEHEGLNVALHPGCAYDRTPRDREDDSRRDVQQGYLPAENPRQKDYRSVITSYSIHYTKLYDFGAAAHLGIFVTVLIALALGYDLREAACIGVIGAADGPTTIIVTKQFAEELLGPIMVVITSYSIHYTKLYETFNQILSIKDN